MNRSGKQTNPDYWDRKLIAGGVAVGGWLLIALACKAIGETFLTIALPIITVPYVIVAVIFYVRYVWFNRFP